jgi:hypothetical protein
MLHYREWFGNVDKEASNSNLERNFALLSSAFDHFGSPPKRILTGATLRPADDALLGEPAAPAFFFAA